LHVHDDGRVRHAQFLRQHDSDLSESLVVRLQTGQHEIERLILDCRGQRLRDGRRIRGRERIAFDVNRPIRAARQRFTNHLRRARRTGTADHDLAPLFLLEAKRFFQRVGVRFVQLEACVSIPNPRLLVVDPQLPLAGDDLLDANGYFHGFSFRFPVPSRQFSFQ
jgi:hypothetical protein